MANNTKSIDSQSEVKPNVFKSGSVMIDGREYNLYTHKECGCDTIIQFSTVSYCACCGEEIVRPK